MNEYVFRGEKERGYRKLDIIDVLEKIEAFTKDLLVVSVMSLVSTITSIFLIVYGKYDISMRSLLMSYFFNFLIYILFAKKFIIPKKEVVKDN